MSSMDSMYIEVIKELPVPTEEEIKRFAEFVSGAHSWYKHLPLVYPGRPFILYLDPNAGRSLVRTQTSDVAFVDITDESPCFHYTWQTTATYRTRFGYWTYYAPYGSSFLLVGEGGMLDTKGAGPMILTPKVGWSEVPDSLMEVGKVWLTALIHPKPRVDLWTHNPQRFGISDSFEKEHALPPAVASGLCRLKALWESEAYQEHQIDIDETKKLLESAIEQERAEQLTAIRQAMKNLVATIY